MLRGGPVEPGSRLRLRHDPEDHNYLSLLIDIVLDPEIFHPQPVRRERPEPQAFDPTPAPKRRLVSQVPLDPIRHA